MSTVSSFWDVSYTMPGLPSHEIDAWVNADEPIPLPPNPAIRWRLIARLAKAGTAGLTRTSIRELAGARDRAVFLAELEYAVRDGQVESILRRDGREASRYRLTPGAVMLIRKLNSAAVTHFPIIAATDFWA